MPFTERRRRRHPPIRPLVLLADGHAETCELYAASLECFDFETTTVADGADVFTHAWQIHPDVIVTEVLLSQTDGWELIGNLKRDPRTRDIPIVIVTSDGHQRARQRAQDEGCSAFLLKPCVPEDLALTLREVLNHMQGP